MTSMTFTKTAAPLWLLAMWKEIDEKTFGIGFDCFADDAVCNLGVADWHGRETIRENLRLFIDPRLHRSPRRVGILGQPRPEDLARQGGDDFRRPFDGLGPPVDVPLLLHE